MCHLKIEPLVVYFPLRANERTEPQGGEFPFCLLQISILLIEELLILKTH